MKTYSWVVSGLLVVHAFSYSQHDVSFLKVHDPIVVAPHGLPPKVYRPAEWQHPHAQKTAKVDHSEEKQKERSHSGHGEEASPNNQHESHEEPHQHESHEESHEEPHQHESHEESHEDWHSEEQASEHASHAEGAHEAEGAHGAEGAHEAEELAEEEESLSLAFLLMGGVGAFMVVFHFANSTDLDIKLSAWRVLSMTVSIFAAVLLYGILKSLIILVFKPNVIALIVMTLGLFVFLFVGSHAFLYKLKSGDEVQVKGAGIILAHICGFAGMYGLADSRELALVEERGTPGMVLLVVCSGVVIAGLSYLMHLVMNKVEQNESESLSRNAEGRTLREEDELWVDTCEEMDDDVFCLAVSFSITLWFRYMIRGRPFPYMPGEVGNVTQHDANVLLACAVFFAVLVFVGTLAHSNQKFHDQIKSQRRIATNAQHLISMIMAWCFLFWSEWQLYVWGWEHTIIGGCLAVAIFMTLFSFGAVVLLCYIQANFNPTKMMKRAIGSLEMALGVLVGFSWERAFDVGFEEIDAKYHHSSMFGPCLVILFSIVLFAIVAPAWRLNILPKVLKLEDKARKRDTESKAQKERDTEVQSDAN